MCSLTPPDIPSVFSSVPGSEPGHPHLPVRHEVAVRREALRTEGGGRPPRWAVAAVWWELSAV